MSVVETVDAVRVINGLAKEIGTWAEGKGFRDDWLLADELHRISRNLYAGRPVSQDDADIVRNAAKVLRNNVIGTKFMLIVSEIAEAMESLRDVGADGVLAHEGNVDEELADAEIRIKDLAYMLGADLGAAEVEKIAKNNHRPYKHGRQF